MKGHKVAGLVFRQLKIKSELAKRHFALNFKIKSSRDLDAHLGHVQAAYKAMSLVSEAAELLAEAKRHSCMQDILYPVMDSVNDLADQHQKFYYMMRNRMLDAYDGKVR
jgi:hypothetical protein